MAEIFNSGSPRWSWTTKLVVGLTFMAIVVGLIIRLRNYIGPILITFVLAYFSYRAAIWLRSSLRISWRLAVGLFYLLLVLLLVGSITLSGLALVQQAQSLIDLLDAAIKAVPGTIDQISHQVITIGPWVFDLSRLEVDSVTNQILSSIQPILGELGSLVGTVATSAASFLGWLAFILLIAFFITSESGGLSSGLFNIHIPGHALDVRRLGVELKRIWNGFLRGQLILFLLSVFVYSIVLSILGMQFAFGLAVLAGFGRFLPYLGPAIAWITYSLVAYFQGHTIFGLTPLGYTGLVIGIAIIIDTIFDNFVSPKILGRTMRVHPAAVLITALIAANLIGVVGVLFAAPVLASLQVLAQYVVRKLFDQDPWDGREPVPEGEFDLALPSSFMAILMAMMNGLTGLWARVRAFFNSTRRSKPVD